MKRLGGWTRLWLGLSVFWIFFFFVLVVMLERRLPPGPFYLFLFIPPIALGLFFLFVEWVKDGFWGGD